MGLFASIAFWKGEQDQATRCLIPRFLHHQSRHGSSTVESAFIRLLVRRIQRPCQRPFYHRDDYQQRLVERSTKRRSQRSGSCQTEMDRETQCTITITSTLGTMGSYQPCQAYL